MAQMTQPTLSSDTDIRIASTNDGSCFLVKVITKVKVTAGIISFTAKGHKLADIELGSSYEDMFVGTYQLCCCRIQGGLDLVDKNDKETFPNPIAPNETIDPENCKCGCKFTYKGMKRSNAAAINWTFEALEGGCKLERSNGSYKCWRTKNT